MDSNAPPVADDPRVLVDAIETIVRLALAPVVARLRAVETTAADVRPAADVLSLQARLDALEAAAAVPGPPGPPGPPGADGLGFDDYRIDWDGERTLTHTWERGTARQSVAVVLPTMIYRGVYVPGKLYARGDVVTWAGSLWHANAETTTRPGDGAPAWTLAVKRGRDGRS